MYVTTVTCDQLYETTATRAPHVSMRHTNEPRTSAHVSEIGARIARAQRILGNLIRTTEERLFFLIDIPGARISLYVCVYLCVCVWMIKYLYWFILEDE